MFGIYDISIICPFIIWQCKRRISNHNYPDNTTLRDLQFQRKRLKDRITQKNKARTSRNTIIPSKCKSNLCNKNLESLAYKTSSKLIKKINHLGNPNRIYLIILKNTKWVQNKNTKGLTMIFRAIIVIILII